MLEFYDHLIDTARELASDTGENEEYDKALVELIGQSMSLPSTGWFVIARLVCAESSPLRTEGYW